MHILNISIFYYMSIFLKCSNLFVGTFQENSEKIGRNERYVTYMLMCGRRTYTLFAIFPCKIHTLPEKKTEEASCADASELLAWTRSRADMIFMGRPKVSGPS